MPALPNVPSTLKMILTWTVGSDTDVVCRAYYQYSGAAPTSAQLATLAGHLESNYATNLAPLADVDTTLTNTELIDLTSPTSGVGNFASSVVGTRSGGILSAQAAAMLNFKIARRYRGGKPRVYLPF